MELLTQELEWGQDNMNENKQDFNLSKEDFQFVQMNEKFLIKNLKQKQLAILVMLFVDFVKIKVV